MQAVSCPRCGAPLQEDAAVCPYCRIGLAPDGCSPEGWVQYRDEWSGFAISHPPGWTVETRRGLISVREDPAGNTAAFIFPSFPKPSGNIREVAKSLTADLHAVDPSFQAWMPGDAPPDANRISLKTRDVHLGCERQGILNLLFSGKDIVLSGYAAPTQVAGQRRAWVAKILSSLRPVERMPRQKFQEPSEGAFLLLFPQGWTIQGMLDRSSGGKLPAFNVTRPPQGLASAGKPSYLWNYQEPQLGMFAGFDTIPRLPFMAATQFCQQVLAPWTSQAQAGFKIESIVDRPDLGEMTTQELIRSGYPRGSHQVSVAIMETSYVDNGARLRQKTQLTCMRMSSQLTFGIPSWTASLDGYYRARDEEFSTLEPVLQGVLDSFTVSRAWEAGQVQQNLSRTRHSQMDIHRRLGEISQTISDTNDMIYDGYKSRQATEDRMAEQRSDATLGVHSVESPTGDVYKVADGYDQYWTNGLGDFYGGDLLTQPDVNWIPLGDKRD